MSNETIFGFGCVNQDFFGVDSPRTKLCLCVSKREVWEKQRECSEIICDDAYKFLISMGCEDRLSGVFELTYVKLSKEGIKEMLIKEGFIYSTLFERYMNDHLEHEDGL